MVGMLVKLRCCSVILATLNYLGGISFLKEKDNVCRDYAMLFLDEGRQCVFSIGLAVGSRILLPFCWTYKQILVVSLYFLFLYK